MYLFLVFSPTGRPADRQIGRLKRIGKKEVKFVTIENLIGVTESEILEWKSSLSQLNRIIETTPF
ncbi:hypothetical protein KJ599_06925 [bacterium]|nr:hypothetical protein [bacterium]